MSIFTPNLLTAPRTTSRNGTFPSLCKKVIFQLTRSFILLSIFQLMNGSIHAQVLNIEGTEPQIIPCANCVAQDIKVGSATLKNYKPNLCKDTGFKVKDTLQINFSVTAAERYGLLIVGKVYIDGSFRQLIDTCITQVLTQGSKTIEIPINDTFVIGQKVQIVSLFTAWDNNKTKNGPGTDYGSWVACSDYKDLSSSPNIKFFCQKVAGSSTGPKCKYYDTAITVLAPAQPYLTIDSITTVNCYGDATGKVYTTVSPVNQSYTYSWTKDGFPYPAPNAGDISTLTAGVYAVSVSVGGYCATPIADTAITQPALPVSPFYSIKNVYCFGDSTGKIKIDSVKGGTPYTAGNPYRFSWKNANNVQFSTDKDSVLVKAGTYTLTVTDSLNCIATRTITITQPTALTSTATTLQHVCKSGTTGSVTVSVSGGTQKTGPNPYSYSWSPGGATSATVTGLTGTALGKYYVVTITDSLNCTKKDSTKVVDPGAGNYLTISRKDSANIKCKYDASGYAKVTVTGGLKFSTNKYQYAWTPSSVSGSTTDSIYGLTVGKYKVLVTDSLACTRTDSFQLKQPDSALTIRLAIKDSLRCYGAATAKAYVTASGGTNYRVGAKYKYYWSNSASIADTVSRTDTASGLSAKKYYVKVVDSLGCSKLDSVTITQPADPVRFASVQQTNVSCYGDSTGRIKVVISGGVSPYVYKWDTATTYSGRDTLVRKPAGTYALSVKDNQGCIKDTSFTITQPARLTADKDSINIKCFGDSSGKAWLKNIAGGTPYTVGAKWRYSWSPGGSSVDTLIQKAGTFTVTLTDSLGCSLQKTFVLKQPAKALTDTIRVKAQVNCFGDSTGIAYVTGYGGTPAYTYVWTPTPQGGGTSDTVRNLKARTYKVVVTDNNGCTVTDSVTITQPAAPITATLDSQNVSCKYSSTGKAWVKVVSGGTPYKTGAPYRYTWTGGGISDTLSNKPSGTYTVTIRDSLGCSIQKSVILRQPDSALVATTSFTKVDCFNDSSGTATVVASGGLGSYKYSWNTNPVQTTATASKLPAGTYIVSVTDSSGCTIQKEVKVTRVSEIVIDTTNKTNIKCFGDSTGAVTIVVTGGTPKASGFTYSWNTNPVQTTPSLTKLTAGKYTVTVTDSIGCTAKATVTITQPPVLSATITKTDVCSESSKGSATVTVTGGTGGYTYKWNTSPEKTTATITNLDGGTYTVTITDGNSCKLTQSVLIRKPDAFLAASTTSENVKCYGESNGTAQVAVTGGVLPYKYSWNTSPVQTTASIANLKAGTYTVTITDSLNCSITKSVTITQPAKALSLNAEAEKLAICLDEYTSIKLEVSGGTAPYSYQLDGGSFGSSTDILKELGPGTYTITVKDANGCTKSATVEIKDKGCYAFCTYTMSYYGTDNNIQAYYNNGAGCVNTGTRSTIEASLSEWASRGAQLKVGNINVSALPNPVEAILKYLPCGGPSLAYTGSTLDANTPNNTLLSQTLTLGLNIGLNQKLDSFRLRKDYIITQRYTGDCADGTPQPGNCQKTPIDPKYKNKSVGEIFTLASNALVSGTPEERSELANMVRTINEVFNKCAVAVAVCPFPNWNLEEEEEMDKPALVVRTYPNPFTDQVYFHFVSPVSGNAVFEIYDFTGRKIQELRKPNVVAYQDNLIQYMVPRTSQRQIMYRIAIGPYSAKGVLISPGK